MNSTLSTYDLLSELLNEYNVDQLTEKLFVHKGTIKRWIKLKAVPDNYFNDLNNLLNGKYENKTSYRMQDQFYTTKKISKYCYKKMLAVVKDLKINTEEYTFIEPSAGCCNFYKQLPRLRRIGIDIDPKGRYRNEIIRSDFLDYSPDLNNKYIVIGNPPFGLRGNLALRFINHSYNFADVVAFILPPLFNSTGKGVPMTRVKGYKLAHTEELPRDSFEYPDGTLVDVSTIFQVWTKVGVENIKIESKKMCQSFATIYSLSDGGLPSNTRNKKMLDKCDVYLPSTCFKGMKSYLSFEELPNRRGYGIVFHKNKKKLIALFTKKIDWEEVAFRSTNGALNLRTELILNQMIEGGYHD